MLCPRTLTSESICGVVISEYGIMHLSDLQMETSPQNGLCQDLLQSHPLERTLVKCCFNGSQVHDRMESLISLGYHKVTAVKPAFQLARKDSLYRCFCEQAVNLSKQGHFEAMSVMESRH